MAYDNSNFTGNCFSLFFDLIISQLFMGAVSAIIEIIKTVTLKNFCKYFIQEEFLQKYGIYFQPTLTAFLFIMIGISMYYFSEWLKADRACHSSDIIKYFILFLIIVVISIIIVFLIYTILKIKKVKHPKIYIN